MRFFSSLSLKSAGTAASLCACVLLAGCANPALMQPSDGVQTRLTMLGPSQVILLGEQHDAVEHQKLEAIAVQQLVKEDHLAALVIEMAEQGKSTRGLSAQATEEDMRAALGWDEKAWPWFQYGPAIVSAVRGKVTVYGGNLPADRLEIARADARLDKVLPEKVWLDIQQRVREGHCNMLPADKIAPMARVQVARDQAMAQTASQAVNPGMIVLVIAGSAHADRNIGIANYLPPRMTVRAIKLEANGNTPETRSAPGAFDDFWRTRPVKRVEYCDRVIPANAAPKSDELY